MGGDPAAGLGQMFNDPNMIQKLASNPKTASFLADPAFMAKLQSMKQNPANAQDLFSDPRMIQVLGVLMGVDMEMRDSDPTQDTPMTDAPSQAKKPEPARKAPEPAPEPEEVDEDALEKKKKKEAVEEEAPAEEPKKKKKKKKEEE